MSLFHPLTCSFNRLLLQLICISVVCLAAPTQPDLPKATPIHPCNTQPKSEDKSLREKPMMADCAPTLEPALMQISDLNKLARSKIKAKRPINLANFFKEEVQNYPENDINEALKRTPTELKMLFNVLNTPLDPNTNLTERTAFYPDDEGREENVCRSVLRNIYPREARRDNSLVYVPNTQDFMQVIQAEICQQPNEDCNFLLDNLPFGMQSSCVQKYSYKKLLFMEPLEKRMASDLFRYPSCCSCYVRRVSLDLRTGLTNSTSPIKQLRREDNLSFNNSSNLLEGANSTSSTTTEELTNSKSFSRQPKAHIPSVDDSIPRITLRMDTLMRSPDDEPGTTRRPMVAHNSAQSRARKSQTSPNSGKTTPSTLVLQADKVYIPAGDTT